MRLCPACRKARHAIALVLDNTEVYLPQDGLVDLAGECERLSARPLTFPRDPEEREPAGLQTLPPRHRRRWWKRNGPSWPGYAPRTRSWSPGWQRCAKLIFSLSMDKMPSNDW